MTWAGTTSPVMLLCWQPGHREPCAAKDTLGIAEKTRKVESGLQKSYSQQNNPNILFSEERDLKGTKCWQWAWSWWKFRTQPLSLLQFLPLQVPSPSGSQPKRTLPICHMYLTQCSSSLTHTLFCSHLSRTCKIDFGLWENNVSKHLRKKWPHVLNLGWTNLETGGKAWLPVKSSSMLLTETSWESVLWFSSSVCEDCEWRHYYCGEAL